MKIFRSWNDIFSEWQNKARKKCPFDLMPLCGKGIKSWRSMLPQVWKYKIFKIWNTNVSMHPATEGQPNISLSTICCKNILLPTPSIFYQKFYWTFEPIQRSRLFSKYECQRVHVLLPKRNRAGRLISFLLKCRSTQIWGRCW